MGVLASSKSSVIIKGDKSLSSRDFGRVIKPLNLFGVQINSKKNKLPLKIRGNSFLRPINILKKKEALKLKVV